MKLANCTASGARWRDSYNPLRGLTISRAVALLEGGERGQMADLQSTYRLIERRSAVCRGLIERRTGALLKTDWDVKTPETLPPGASASMAIRQRATLARAYRRIENLREALKFLLLAEFRGFAHLQVQGEGNVAGFEAIRGDGAIRLQPLNQFLWVRDGSDGGWGWNPEAAGIGWESVPGHRRADPEGWGLIIREEAMPLDEIALIGFVRKSMSQKDWDAFIEIYGIPGGVVTMPPGIPDGREAEYEDAAVKVAEGGSGGLPYGSTYKPNAAPQGNNPFRDHIRYQDEDLVLAGTGGKLTMLAEAGSGSLAGGAHQKAFDDILAADVREVSEVMQRQFDRRVLGLLHPGEPQCAYWDLRIRGANDPVDGYVDRVVKLAKTGMRVSAEQASEKTGLRLVDATRGPRRETAAIRNSREVGKFMTGPLMPMTLGGVYVRSGENNGGRPAQGERPAA